MVDKKPKYPYGDPRIANINMCLEANWNVSGVRRRAIAQPWTTRLAGQPALVTKAGLGR